MKNPMYIISGAYKRLRHTYGFGVHSPLAYNFVSTVISPQRGTGYYAYDDIDDCLMSSGKMNGKLRRECRMLLRTVVFTNPRTVWLSETAADIYMKTLNFADSRIKRIGSPSEADMIAASDKSLIAEDLLGLAQCGSHVFLLRGYGEECLKAFFALTSGGVWFMGKENSIFILRDDVRKLCYTVKI